MPSSSFSYQCRCRILIALGLAGAWHSHGCAEEQEHQKPCEATCSAFIECVDDPESAGIAECALEHACEHSPCETWADAALRQQQVAARRNVNPIFVHRGASELAAENTLEAYRATFELGAEGNEVDVNQTSDGILVAFHDPFPSWQLEALVDWDNLDWQQPDLGPGYLLLSDLTLSQMQRFPFRSPQQAAEYARVPSIAEVLVLHLKYAGLLHLDIKATGVNALLIALLDALDLWEHVTHINGQAADADILLAHPAFQPANPQQNAKAQRADFDLEAMQNMTSNLAPQEALFVGDPSMALLARGDTPGALSVTPVRESWPPLMPLADTSITTVKDWLKNSLTSHPSAEPGTDISRRRMLARAAAALWLAKKGARDQDLLELLDTLLHQRTLDPDWRFHAIDGAEALFAWLALSGGIDCNASWCDAASRIDFAISQSPQTLAPPPGFPPASDWRMQMGLWAYLAKASTAEQRRARGELVQGYLNQLQTLAVQPFETIVEEIAKARLALLPIDDEPASHDAAISVASSLLRHPNLIVQRRSAAELRKRAIKEPWAAVALAR